MESSCKFKWKLNQIVMLHFNCPLMGIFVDSIHCQHREYSSIPFSASIRQRFTAKEYAISAAVLLLEFVAYGFKSPLIVTHSGRAGSLTFLDTRTLFMLHLTLVLHWPEVKPAKLQHQSDPPSPPLSRTVGAPLFCGRKPCWPTRMGVGGLGVAKCAYTQIK